jgi:UDP-N-acetylmuramyl pentapeptide phosphotransferase/UDP-N-acetylglucosamine-1-phosphate transferase
VTLRGGGIIFYLGALVYFITAGWAYPLFVAGLTLITVISFTDDIRPVSQRVRLVFHFTGMGLIFCQWEMFDLQWSWWYVIIAMICCTGIINAYNFMDGINGITGGYSLVVLLSLGYINEYMTPFTDSRLICVLILAVTVFNFFNFRKRAKCFAGDAGSVGMAFILVFLIGQLVLTARDLSYIVLLVVYGVDAVLTILHRVMLHENIGLPHRKHTYQIMANELKMPHIAVSLIYMCVQALIVAGFIVAHGLGYGYGYLCAAILFLSLVYIVFMKKYFHLHLNNSNAR